MSTKVKIILGVILLLTSYGFGRWSTPVKVEIKTITVEIEKKQTDTEKNKNTHTTIVEISKPDGTKEKTTTTDTSTHSDTQITDNKNTATETDKITIYASPKVSILATYGVSLHGEAPEYGAEINKPFLGPLTLGIFGHTPGVIGVAFGLTL